MTSKPSSHYYESQRLKLHFLDWGNPSAEPLLLVHGGRDHARMWDWVAGPLSKNYHILAVDLRGHGDSDWSNSGHYHVDDFVHDIAEFIVQLDLAPLKMLSHSLGGVISLRYTGVFPERVKKLIAIEGLGRRRPDLGFPEGSLQERYRTWIDKHRETTRRVPKRYTSIDEATKRMAEGNKRLSEEQARHLTEHGIKQNDDGTYSWKFDNFLYGRFLVPNGINGADTKQLWSEITCPTLLVRGTDSWTTDPEEDGDAEYFKNATFVNFEGAGHWVHHDRLDDFLTLATDFLAD